MKNMRLFFLLVITMFIATGFARTANHSKPPRSKVVAKTITGNKPRLVSTTETAPALIELKTKLQTLIASDFTFNRHQYNFGGSRTIVRTSPFGPTVKLSGPTSSVYVRDLKSGAVVDINADEKNMVASTLKVLVVASVYYYWKNNIINLDTQTERVRRDFVLIIRNSYNPASNDLIALLGKAYLETLSGKADFSHQTVANKKTTIEMACLVKFNGGNVFPTPEQCVNDMVAAYNPVIRQSQLKEPRVVYFLFGLEAINDFLKKELPEFRGRVREWIPVDRNHDGQTYLNQASAKDMGILLEAIYQARFLPNNAAQDFIQVMANNFEGRENFHVRKKLAKSLPPGIEIAPKTGYVNGGNGAIAIVFVPDRPYVITVFIKSDGQKEAKAASELITQIGAMTYKYFSSSDEPDTEPNQTAVAFRH